MVALIKRWACVLLDDHVQGVFTTGFGFFLLGGVNFHLLNVIGIALNTFGGVWYSLIKFQSE
jgi:solute carrier family 35 protein